MKGCQCPSDQEKYRESDERDSADARRHLFLFEHVGGDPFRLGLGGSKVQASRNLWFGNGRRWGGGGVASVPQARPYPAGGEGQLLGGEHGLLGIDPAGHFVERRRSEEHTSELQSLMRISYAVFCLKQ